MEQLHPEKSLRSKIFRLSQNAINKYLFKNNLMHFKVNNFIIPDFFKKLKI